MIRTAFPFRAGTLLAWGLLPAIFAMAGCGGGGGDDYVPPLITSYTLNLVNDTGYTVVFTVSDQGNQVTSVGPSATVTMSIAAGGCFSDTAAFYIGNVYYNTSPGTVCGSGTIDFTYGSGKVNGKAALEANGGLLPGEMTVVGQRRN